MKRFLSINNWNSSVDYKPLEEGDYVAFIPTNSNILRVGVIVTPPEGKIAPCVKCLTNGKLYYPYSSQIMLFNDNTVVKELISTILEVE